MKNNDESVCGRKAWLEAALKTLSNEGVDNVRVERLARDLGVTKGSFYWHFKNRNDLLEQIIYYWSDEMTALVFEKVAHLEVDPKAKILALLEEITLKRRGKFDPPIRSWSKNDKAVAKAVRKVDGQRLAFLAGLFSQAGFNTTDADIRSQLLYGYMIGESSVLHHVDKKHELDKLQSMLKVITAKPA